MFDGIPYGHLGLAASVRSAARRRAAGNPSRPAGRIYGRQEGRLRGKHRRRGAAGGPLWRKAPLALLRYPGLLGAVVLGSLLVSLVASAYPLFVSRSEGTLLASELRDPTVSRYGAGILYSVTNVLLGEEIRGTEEPLVERLDAAIARIASEGPHLGRPTRFVFGPTAAVTRPGASAARSGPIEGQVVSVTDAADHVEIAFGDASDGALVPDLIADVLGVGPGDELELDAKASIRVGAVYRSLYSRPRSGFWSPWSEDIFPQCPDCAAPPQFIIVGPDDVIDLSERLFDPEERDLPPGVQEAPDVDYAWVAPIERLPITVDEARAVDAYAIRTIHEASRRGTALRRVLRCCGTTYVGFPFVGRRDIEFRSAMPLVLREVDRRTATVEGPLRLLLIAGLGVAGAVVAAAAAFAVAGRRTEAALLHARGWGPGRFAARAAVEAFLPVVVGSALGLAAGSGLVALFGPAAPAAASASRDAVVAATAAAAAALLVLGVVSAVSFIRTFEVHALRRRLAWVPWEVLAIVGSLWILSRLRSGGALIEDPALGIRRPSALLLAFTVLFVGGFGTLGARLLVAALRRSPTAASPAPYLAAHRLTGLPGLTVLLVGAAGLCLGVFVNGQTIVRSLRATVDAKAGVFVGSDVQVSIDRAAPEQDTFPYPITRTTRLKYGGRLLPSDVPFDIVGIDAETIADAAYWEPSFADTSLEELVRPLRSDGDGPLPVLLVQGGGDPAAIDTAQEEVPVEVVGRADAFPGVSSDDPVVVVDMATLERTVGPQGNPFFSANARTEYWIRGDPAEVLAAVGDLEAFPLDTLTAEEVKDVPFIRAAIETFAMLNVLGLAAALLVAGVLVVYLQARQRARSVSNVLSLRMGMRDGQAAVALVLELGAILLAAFVLGGALGLAAGRLVAPLLDPLQTIPPVPIFAVPVTVLLWTAAAAIAVALVGGWLVHRRAASVDLGEVLRVAE